LPLSKTGASDAKPQSSQSNHYNKVLHEDGKVNKGIDHHNCAFGKWYEGEGTKSFGKSNSFKDIKKPHALVHKSANDNLKIVEKHFNNFCWKGSRISFHRLIF